MFYSLRFKINFAILLTFILITMVFGGILLPFQKKNQAMGIEKTRMMLALLARRENNVLANEIFENRLVAINMRITSLMIIPEMVGIQIFNKQGFLIGSSQTGPTISQLNVPMRQSLAEGHDLELSKWKKTPVVIYTREVQAIGDVLGYIRIAYSIDDLVKAQRHSFFIFLSLLVSVLLTMLIILNILLSKSILSPITKLKNMSRQIMEKGPGHQVGISSKDEIGELSKTFNQMSVSLKQSNQQIEKQGKELWDTKNYLDNIINSMPSVLIGVDVNGTVTQWNRTAEHYTGISAEKALGQLLHKVFPRLSAQMDTINESIRTRETKMEQKKMYLSEGGVRYEDIIIYPLTANQVEGAVIRVDDVTEKVRLEEMMVQSEKMLSVGGLAAGMAHEINNPLAGMIQNAAVLGNRLKDINMKANLEAAKETGISMETIRTYMEKRNIFRMLSAIEESGRRMAETVSNMLSFARKTEGQYSSHSLEDLIAKTLELARTDFDLKKNFDFKMIQIDKDFEKAMPMVSCEGAKIQQVLLNILRNGAQAMQKADIQNPGFHLQTWYDARKNMACLSIKDNGPGMEEEVRKRIFEPFFTTKPVGVGTGIGLSVSYFIITENHNGEMDVESSPGKGARFIIRLPLSPKSNQNTLVSQ